MRRADAFATRRAAIRSRPQKFCANPAQSPGTSSTPALPQRRGNSRIFRTAERAGAILTAQSIGELAAAMRVPADVLGKEWNYVEALKARGEVDRYGRPFAPEQRLLPPFRAVKVTGALFSYARRPGDRCNRPREAQRRNHLSQPVCRRRSGGRRVGHHGGGLSVRQWSIDCDRPGPFCRGGCGRAGFALSQISSAPHRAPCSPTRLPSGLFAGTRSVE